MRYTYKNELDMKKHTVRKRGIEGAKLDMVQLGIEHYNFHQSIHI